MALKQLVGLLLVVLVCHAGVIQQAEEDYIFYEDLDLSGNAEGQFAADLEGGQDLGLSDQSFKRGPWRGTWGDYGDEHSNEIIHGGHGVVQYLTTSLRTSPQVVVFDNSYLYFGRYPSIRRRCHYNRQNYRFNFNGHWQGNIHSVGHHAKQIAFLFETVVRIQFVSNFFRCYNSYNQVVIIIQRIAHPFVRSSRWLPPVWPHDYKQYQRYHPYAWGNNEWTGSVGNSQND